MCTRSNWGKPERDPDWQVYVFVSVVIYRVQHHYLDRMHESSAARPPQASTAWLLNFSDMKTGRLCMVRALKDHEDQNDQAAHDNEDDAETD